jgi:hypothetical protein
MLQLGLSRLLKKKEEENFLVKRFKLAPHINEIKDRMQLLGNSGDYDM